MAKDNSIFIISETSDLHSRTFPLRPFPSLFSSLSIVHSKTAVWFNPLGRWVWAEGPLPSHVPWGSYTRQVLSPAKLKKGWVRKRHHFLWKVLEGGKSHSAARALHPGFVVWGSQLDPHICVISEPNDNFHSRRPGGAEDVTASLRPRWRLPETIPPIFWDYTDPRKST